MSRFAQAERAFRRGALFAGLGVMSWLLGTALWVSVVSLLIDAERAAAWSEPARLVLYVVVQHLWLFSLLPALGWAVARARANGSADFALTAGLAGELFFVLSETATDDPGGGWPMVVATLIAFVSGVSVAALAARRAGRQAAAQGRA